MRIGRGSRQPELPGRGEFIPAPLEIIVTRPDPAEAIAPRPSRLLVYAGAALVAAIALVAILWPSPSSTTTSATTTATTSTTTTPPTTTTASDLSPRGQLGMTAYRLTEPSGYALTEAYAFDPKQDSTARTVNEPYLTPARSYLTLGEPRFGSVAITAEPLIRMQGVPANPAPVEGMPITVAQTAGLDVSNSNQPNTIEWVDRSSGAFLTAQGLDVPQSTLIALAGAVRVRRQGDGTADLRFANLPAGWDVSDSRAYVSTEAGWTLRYTDPATSDFTSGVTITGSAHLVGIADVVEAELQRQAPALAINVNGRQGWVVIGQTQFAPGNQTTTSLIFEMTGGMTVRIDATATAEQTLAMAKQLVPILPSEWPNLDLKPTASPPPPSDQLNYTTFALTVNRLDGGAPAMAYLFRSGVACLDLGGGDFYAACSPLSIENENSWVSASGPIASGIVRTAGLVPGYVTRVRILPDVGPPTEVVPQFDVDTSVRAFVADTPPPAHWVDVELLDAHGNIIRRIPHRNAGTRLPVAGPPALSDPSWKPATIVQGYNPATLTEPQVLVRQTTYKDGTTGECVLFSMPSTTTSTDYNDCGRRPLPTAGDEPSVWVTVSSSRPVIMAVLPPGAVHAEIVYPFSNVVDLPIWAGATRKYVAITAEAGRYPLELRFRSADGTIIATAGFGPTQNYFAYGGSS